MQLVVTARYLDSLCPGTIDVQVVRENELTVLRGVCLSEKSKKKRYNVVVKLGAIRRHQKQLLSMQGFAEATEPWPTMQARSGATT